MDHSYKKTLYGLLEATEKQKDGNIVLSVPGYYSSKNMHRKVILKEAASSSGRSASGGIVQLNHRDHKTEEIYIENHCTQFRAKEDKESRANLYILKDKENQLREQSRAVRDSLRKLENVQKYCSNDPIDAGVYRSRGRSDPGGIGDEGVYDDMGKTTADEIADEQKALKRDRKRLSIFTKENVAPIVPAQIELAQFRREKKLKMVAYAKQMKETSKMVAKAGEEMMHHTKNELRRNIIDRFIYCKAGARFMKCLRAQLARKALVKKGHIYKLVRMCRGTLKQLKKYHKISSKPKHVHAIISFKASLAALRVLYAFSQQSRDIKKAVDAFNRRRCSKWIAVWKDHARVTAYWRGRAKRVALLKLRKAARRLIWEWREVTRKSVARNKRIDIIKYKQASMFMKLGFLAKAVAARKALNKKYQRMDRACRLIRCRTWLLWMREKNIQEHARVLRLHDMIIRARSHINFRRKNIALAELCEYTIAHRKARKAWVEGVRAVHKYQKYRFFIRLFVSAKTSIDEKRQNETSARGYLSLYKRLMLVKGMRAFRRLLSRQRRGLKRVNRLPHRLPLTEEERISKSFKKKGSTSKKTFAPTADESQTHEAIEKEAKSSIGILRRVVKAVMPVIYFNILAGKWKHKVDYAFNNLRLAKGLVWFKRRIEQRDLTRRFKTRLDEWRRAHAAKRWMRIVRRNAKFRKQETALMNRALEKARRQLCLKKGLRIWRKVAQNRSFISHSLSVRKGDKLRRVLLLFATMQKWNQKYSQFLIPMRKKVRQLIEEKNYDKKYFYFNLLYRQRNLGKVIAGRIHHAVKLYNRIRGRPLLRQWKNYARRKHLIRMTFNLAHKVRLRLAWNAYKEFTKKRTSYVLGVDALAKKMTLGIRFNSTILKYKGWQEFREGFVRVRANRIQEEKVVKTWNLKVYIAVFAHLKQEFFTPFLYDKSTNGDWAKALRRTFLLKWHENMFRMKDDNDIMAISVKNDKRRLRSKGFRWLLDHVVRCDWLKQKTAYFRHTAMIRGLKAFKNKIDRKKFQILLSDRCKPTLSWRNYRYRLLLTRLSMMYKIRKNRRRMKYTLKLFFLQKAFNLLRIKAKRNHVPKNKHHEIPRKWSQVGLKSDTWDNRTPTMVHRNTKYAVGVAQAIHHRGKVRVYLRWLHQIAFMKRPERTYGPMVRFNGKQFCMKQAIKHWLSAKKYQLKLRQLHNMMCDQLNFSHKAVYFDHWRAILQMEKDLDDLALRNKMKRGVRKLLKNLKERRQNKRTIDKVHAYYKHYTIYNTIVYFIAYFHQRKAQRIIKLHKCRWAFRIFKQWNELNDEKRGVVAIADDTNRARLMKVAHNYVFLAFRYRGKERRAVKLFLKKQRRAMLLKGIQSFDMQVARRWGLRLRYERVSDAWRRAYILKRAMRTFRAHTLGKSIVE